MTREQGRDEGLQLWGARLSGIQPEATNLLGLLGAPRGSFRKGFTVQSLFSQTLYNLYSHSSVCIVIPFPLNKNQQNFQFK